jgi:hypothetical protein
MCKNKALQETHCEKQAICEHPANWQIGLSSLLKKGLAKF